MRPAMLSLAALLTITPAVAAPQEPPSPTVQALGGLAGYGGQDDHQNPPPVPGWHTDLAAGMKEAAETGKPMLVVFR